MKITPLTAYIMALLAVTVWAGNFVVGRFSQTEMDLAPTTLALYRWACAFVFALPLLVRISKSQWREGVRNAPILLLFSLCGVVGFSIFTYVAAEDTTSINLSIIAITAPLFIPIFRYLFFRLTTPPLALSGLLLSLMGVLVLLSDGNMRILLDLKFRYGDLWMLAATACWAMYNVLFEKRPVHLNAEAFFFFTIVLGLPFLMLAALLDPTGGIVAVTTGDVWVIWYLGFFVSVIGFLLWNAAAKTLGPVKVGAIYFFIPVMTTGLAVIFLEEALSTSQIFGALLIMTGIFFVQIVKIIAVEYRYAVFVSGIADRLKLPWLSLYIAARSVKREADAEVDADEKAFTLSQVLAKNFNISQEDARSALLNRD